MLMVYGALIGLLNGFFGSGGGILAVTLLQKQGLPSRQAHATSIEMCIRDRVSIKTMAHFV